LGTVLAKNEKEVTGLKMQAEPNVLAVKSTPHNAPKKFGQDSVNTSEGTSEDSWNDRMKVQRRGDSHSSDASAHTSRDRVMPVKHGMNKKRYGSWGWDVKKAPKKDNATSEGTSDDTSSHNSNRELIKTH